MKVKHKAVKIITARRLIINKPIRGIPIGGEFNSNKGRINDVMRP
jgi:hypothetical protein